MKRLHLIAQTETDFEKPKINDIDLLIGRLKILLPVKNQQDTTEPKEPTEPVYKDRPIEAAQTLDVNEEDVKKFARKLDIDEDGVKEFARDFDIDEEDLEEFTSNPRKAIEEIDEEYVKVFAH